MVHKLILAELPHHDHMITLLLLVCATYMYGVVLHTHPVHGESYNQRITTKRLQQQPLFFTPNRTNRTFFV